VFVNDNLACFLTAISDTVFCSLYHFIFSPLQKSIKSPARKKYFTRVKTEFALKKTMYTATLNEKYASLAIRGQSWTRNLCHYRYPLEFLKIGCLAVWFATFVMFCLAVLPFYHLTIRCSRNMLNLSIKSPDRLNTGPFTMSSLTNTPCFCFATLFCKQNRTNCFSQSFTALCWLTGLTSKLYVQKIDVFLTPQFTENNSLNYLISLYLTITFVCEILKAATLSYATGSVVIDQKDKFTYTNIYYRRHVVKKLLIEDFVRKLSFPPHSNSTSPIEKFIFVKRNEAILHERLPRIAWRIFFHKLHMWSPAEKM